MRFEEYVIFNPPIYDEEWWSYTKPLLEEYKRKAELMREILSESNGGNK